MINRSGYTEYSLDELAKLHTRELMAHFENVRAYRQSALENFKFKEESLQEAKCTLDLYDDYIPILKDVLSTREHIPNKQEAKVIRQQKAKDKKSR
jgi:hypothetical protein